MRILTVVLVSCIAAVILTLAITSTTGQNKTGSYGENRALIEDLQARYMFALDFGDVDACLSAFAPDGILDIGEGEIMCYEAIRKIIGEMPAKKLPSLYSQTQDL
jgi:hypothetical protein